MTTDQATILVILSATVLLFLWGRWRHDVVAVAALIACVAVGLVPSAEAFSGLGHPAVVTVACVLVLSRTLQTSGAIDVLAERFLPTDRGPTVTIGALAGLGAFLSAFMNNVGALALLMPVAIQLAGKQGLPPGRLLMPLAFGSILGGMTTLIGTPPNLIVAGFRAEVKDAPFGMFDFTPVGLAVALAGVAFIALVGWRLVPDRERTGVEDFDTGAYLTEARVPKKAKAVGMTMRELEQALEEDHAQLVGLVRNEVRIGVPRGSDVVRPRDILVIEAEPDGITAVLSGLGLELEEAVEPKKDEQSEGEDEDENNTRDNDIVLMELAILPNAPIVGRSATQARIRSRFGINLLAVSRQGRRSVKRLRSMRLQAGDVLLMQGSSEAISEFASHFACVPLAERALRIPDKKHALLATFILAGSIGLTATGIVTAAVAFAAGVVGVVLARLISPRRLYDAIDWPVIVLLGALLPVAGAMATTGAADLVARALLEWLAQGNAIIALALILIVTMTLSDLVNNAATAAVMCPIAISTAASLGVEADPFLMAVAVGASCAFLTPIGHQNNTLILGPGGFRFSDYWRLGLPMEIIVVAIGVPMILLVWPL
ncbi:MAG: SLC13 family permease [Geminicoccaceae bacterium]|nr:MAG: SLC13 family permease [Geminicoccaceae bacterium]